MLNLAETHRARALKELQRARDLYEQILITRRQVLGDNHPATIKAMNNFTRIRVELEDGP